jgi:hypothetical protein
MSLQFVRDQLLIAKVALLGGTADKGPDRTFNRRPWQPRLSQSGTDSSIIGNCDEPAIIKVVCQG